METRLIKIPHVVALIAALVATTADGAAINASSDLNSPRQRQAVVARAEQLARAPRMASTVTDLPDLFNPPGFEQPDPKATGTQPAVADHSIAVPPETPASDRETLATIASRIPSAGTMIYEGNPVLTIGTHRIGVGQVFTVPFNGHDYDLEIAAISGTTFTLRYRNEEFTRAIRLAK